MPNLGPKTKKNLEDAFAGESQARNKYDYFAKAARNEGYIQIAKIFEETALNEKEHANLWAKRLDLIGGTEANLKSAADGEHYETTEMYVRMAREADEEGHTEIAELFRMTAKTEKGHETRYRKLLTNIVKDQVFKRDEVSKWRCSNCGHNYEGEEAPDICPNCLHPQNYFEIFIENY